MMGKRKPGILFAIIFTSLIILGVLPKNVSCATIKVPEDYSTIQAALLAASYGDIIEVSAGDYYGPISLVSGVEILGAGTDITTISLPLGFTGPVVLAEGVDSSTKIDGFTITGGAYHINSKGGGIYCDESDLTISNNTITGNYAHFGGGIYCVFSSPTISDNIIVSNTATFGGGIYCEDSVPNITGNFIADNFADYRYGGIYCIFSSAEILNNTISDNSSDDNGGGITFSDSTLFIANNIISGNSTANNNGGGILCGPNGDSTILNNTISGNSAVLGGGIFCNQSSDSEIINCIIWGNTATSGGDIYLQGMAGSNGYNNDYSDMYGSWTDGSDNIDVDPSFAGGGDYHLNPGSPCIDVGLNVEGLPLEDFEGDPRIYNGTVDIGADEYMPPQFIEMVSFVIKKAKIDFKKKHDDEDDDDDDEEDEDGDDKIRVEGRFVLNLDNGSNGVDITDDVTVTIGSFTWTINMEEKSKGKKWEYKSPKNSVGIKNMKIDWKKYPEGKFDIRVDNVDLGEMSSWTNPVTISIQIGDDLGEATIQMREKKHHWDYKD